MNRGRILHTIVAALCLAQGGPAVYGQECETWLENFPTTELDGRPWDAMAWDDGDGPALYAGGDFTSSGGGAVALNAIGRYDGDRWEALNGGMGADDFEPFVRQLTVFDDGGGARLYAAGGFLTAGGAITNSIASWDGALWSDLAGGLTNSDGNPGSCTAMAAFNDGSGALLYVWGGFASAGGVPADGFACWDGSNWIALNDDMANGSANNYVIYDLEVFDDGSGPALYAGGSFDTGRGHLVTGVAKWEGDAWAALDVQFPAYIRYQEVRDLHVADLGDGERLYVGGEFVTTINGNNTDAIVAWDGQAWHNLDTGLADEGSGGAVVYGLGSYDLGGGTLLFAAGDFEARWLGADDFVTYFDGSTWHPMEVGTSRYATCLAPFDRGDGPRMWVLGTFSSAGRAGSPDIAAWDGLMFERASVGLLDSTFVRDLATFDDGAGQALFAGGWLSGAGYGTTYLARLDGETWTAYPEIRGIVRDLGEFDIGSGPSLYAASEVSGVDATVLRLDGGVWERAGSTLFSGAGYVLEAFDAGSGPELYCGGNFNGFWGAYSNGGTYWDGSVWASLEGLDDAVQGWAVLDDGSGEAIYAAGIFDNVNGQPCTGVARWNGSAWECLGGGLNGYAYALEVFDDGTGPALYVGGRFSVQGPNGASRGIARWTGTMWEALGDGLGGSNSVVFDLHAFDDGTGPALYVGGNFIAAGSHPVANVARWTGSDWEIVGLGVGAAGGEVSTFASFDDGSGPRLAAGGRFIQMDGLPSGRVAAWDGVAWAPLGTGMDDRVAALQAYDDGSGERLYAAGEFLFADGQLARVAASWDGSNWQAVGTLDDRSGRDLYSLAVFDPGTGPLLYAGGRIERADNQPVSFLAAWNGSGWSPAPGTNRFINSLETMTYQGQAILAVGGDFWLVGRDDTVGLAKLEGDLWTAVPGSTLDGGVTDLRVHNDGGGDALYMVGSFTSPGMRVARFDGSQWLPFGDGFNNTAYTVEIFDDGNGPALYAGGAFTESGGTSVQRVAKWNGTSWEQIGGGIDNGIVADLVAHAGPNGPWLVAVGSFTSIEGGTPSDRVAAWDGAQWISFSPGLNSEAFCALSTTEGDNPSLLIGGSFETAGGNSAGAIAAWGACPPPPCVADFNNDGHVNTLDMLAFLNAWTAGNSSADVNGDGSVNTLDVLAFLNLWNAGC